MGSRTFGITCALSIFYFVSVAAADVSTPILEPITEPFIEKPHKFIYNETSNVTLMCGLPPSTEDNIRPTLSWEIKITCGVLNTSNSTEDGGNITLTIIYDNYCNSVVEVTCIATNISDETETSYVEIEQYYRTTSVHITDEQHTDLVNVTLKPEESKQLYCRGNGNPEPQFQWYNHNNSIDTPLADGNTTSHWFKMPSNISSQATYVCGAKTDNMSDFLKSEPVTVYSWYSPPPTIEPLTTAKDVASNKFTFLDATTVSIRCFLPTEFPEPVPLVIDAQLTPASSHVKNIFKTYGMQEVNLTIEYDLDEPTVPLVNVNCSASKPDWLLMETSLVDIESVYSANRVQISGPTNRIAEPGFDIELSCSAFGTPPLTFQWYIWQNNAYSKIADATNPTYEISVPSEHPSEEKYVCGAKNDYNDNFVQSNPVTVTSLFLPPPTIESFSAIIKNTSNTFTYLDEVSVSIRCFLPSGLPEDVKVEMNVELNPAQSHVKNLIKSNGQQQVNLTIEYDLDDHIIPVVSVYCLVTKPGWKLSTSSRVNIESYYTANRVRISGSENRTAEPGDIIELACTAFGNPPPKFQWYMLDNNETSEIVDATNATYQIRVDSDNSHEERYVCGAKNEYSNVSVKSEPVTVFFKHISLPTFESFSTIVKNTSNTFTYLDATNVSIRCFLPSGVPEDAKVEMFEQVTPNSSHVKNITKTYGMQEVDLTIEYDLEDPTVPLVTVICLVSKSFWSNYSVVDVESHYTANRVRISGSNNRTAEPGDTIELSCSAFGNPPPKFQWYKRDNNKLSAISGATNPTYLVSVPSDHSSEEQYVCGAKNDYNDDYVKSEPVTVAANLLPTTTPTTNSASMHSSSYVLLLSVTIALILSSLRN